MSTFTIPLNTQLTQNFTLAELCRSPSAEKARIVNTPDDYPALRNLIYMAEVVLQPARNAVGPLKINSAYRNAKTNDITGGVENSDHQRGLAVDVIPVQISVTELARWFVKNLKAFDQIILEYGTMSNPAVVHVGMGPRMRRDLYYTPDMKSFKRITL